MRSLCTQPQSSALHHRGSRYPPASTNSMKRPFVTFCRSMANAATSAVQVGHSLSHANGTDARSTPSMTGPGGMSIHSSEGAGPSTVGEYEAGAPLLLERQSMPHVEQRLLVHGLVFEDREHGVGAIEQRIAWPHELLVFERVDHARVGFLDKRAYRSPRRPLRVPSAIRLRFVRIDASREQRLEPRVDAGPAERLLHEGVEAEARQVAVVEDDRMAQRRSACCSRHPRAACRTARESVPGFAGTAEERQSGRSASPDPYTKRVPLDSWAKRSVKQLR